MSISPDLRFHIAELDTPDEALKQLNKVFGIKNEIRAHQLENELLILDPNNFSSIEYFLFKFKTLRLLLKGVKVKKKYGILIYSILTKLGPTYFCFFSPSILLEKPLSLKDKPTSPPLLMPFMII